MKDGMRARFEAGFAGNPKPEITWYYNGKPIEQSANMVVKVTTSVENPDYFVIILLN